MSVVGGMMSRGALVDPWMYQDLPAAPDRRFSTRSEAFAADHACPAFDSRAARSAASAARIASVTAITRTSPGGHSAGGRRCGCGAELSRLTKGDLCRECYGAAQAARADASAAKKRARKRQAKVAVARPAVQSAAAAEALRLDRWWAALPVEHRSTIAEVYAEVMG